MYYFSDSDQQFGPFTLDELKNKKITKTTLVWKEGMENWEPAENVEELKGIAISIPPPLPNQKSTKANSNSTIPSTSKINSEDEPYIPFEEYKEDVAVFIGIMLILIGGFIYFMNNNSSHNSDTEELHGLLMVIVLLVRIVVCFYSTQVAARLNRSQALWGIIGFLLPGIGLIILGSLKRKEKIITLDSSAPKNIQAETLVSGAQSCMKDEQFSTAIKFLNKALAINPNLIPAQFYKAEVYFKKGFHKEAKEIFTLLKDDNSFGAKSNYYIANILIQDKKLSEAKVFLDNADLDKNAEAKSLFNRYYSYEGIYLMDEISAQTKIESYSSYHGCDTWKYINGINEIDKQPKNFISDNSVYLSKYGVVCKFQKNKGDDCIAVRYSEISEASLAENELTLSLLGNVTIRFSIPNKGTSPTEYFSQLKQSYKNLTGMEL